DKEKPYRFYLEGLTIDLIPFGGISQNDEVVLDDPHMKLSVYGCREVTEEAIVLHDKYCVITLPGLCVLKIVAYSEKPGRVKDWDDFLLIANNYSDITGDQLFNGEYEDLFDDDFDLTFASVRMLGRHMNSILSKNDALKQTVLDLLGSKLGGFRPEEINQMNAVREWDDTQVQTLKLISEIIKGIND
ncbi:MAG: hypothetical protein WC810_28025, partial [Janthinobacterium sp.]